MRTKRKSLAEALWPLSRRRLLGLLLSDPEREWHLREIVRRARMAPATVQREVLSLAEAGILSRRREGRQVYYRANTECPIFPELRGLILKTVGLRDVLAEALRRLPGVRVAFVYGSFARGEAGPASDVDLLVVGDVTFGEVTKRLQRAQEQLSREINPTVYSPAELRNRLAHGHHFTERVLAQDKLFIIGDADVLAELAGPRVAGAAPDQP